MILCSEQMGNAWSNTVIENKDVHHRVPLHIASLCPSSAMMCSQNLLMSVAEGGSRGSLC